MKSGCSEVDASSAGDLSVVESAGLKGALDDLPDGEVIGKYVTLRDVGASKTLSDAYDTAIDLLKPCEDLKEG